MCGIFGEGVSRPVTLDVAEFSGESIEAADVAIVEAQQREPH